MKSLPVLGKIYKYKHKHEMTGYVMVMAIKKDRLLVSYLFGWERLRDTYRNVKTDEFMKDYKVFDGNGLNPLVQGRLDSEYIRRINLLCALHDTKCSSRLPKLLQNGLLAFEKQ